MLGKKLRDVVTGYEGIAIGHVEYLTGCNQVLLVPPVDKDGKRHDGEWFDVDRLEVVDESTLVLPGRARLEVASARAVGGDRDAPKK